MLAISNCHQAGNAQYFWTRLAVVSILPALLFMSGCASVVSPDSALVAADTSWSCGTTVTALKEADGESKKVTGTWKDSSCATNCNDNQQCGTGLTYFKYEFPSSDVGCPSDSTSGTNPVETKSYSPAGDAKYYEFDTGAQKLDDSDGCSYSYEDKLRAHKCCSCTETTFYSDGDEDNSSCSRSGSCYFDSVVDASSFTNSDGTVYFGYVANMEAEEDSSSDHDAYYSGSVTFPDADPDGNVVKVFAAVPVLSGMTNALEGSAEIYEWKTTLTSSGYLTASQTVNFSGEIHLHGDGEDLDTSKSMLAATLIALPENVPSAVQLAGGRIPTLGVFKVPLGGTAECVGIYGGSVDAPYSCNGGNGSPNFSASGQTITLTIEDLASNQQDPTATTQQVSTDSAVFIQSARLEYSDDRKVKELKLNSGEGSLTIEDRICPSTGSCSQEIKFTPDLKLESNDHSATSDSYITVVLLVLYDYGVESDQ